ncbi:class I SAM-dependent methyltransferase [Nonomuraea angiospora]|uniref:class I SAM-dependent methyltransferase n=1 Tax=Nonomuraea angiospora TaxID=46172 RepID=UPI0033EE9C8E
MSGIDSSAGMLELARRRLGDGADLQVADLRDPRPWRRHRTGGFHGRHGKQRIPSAAHLEESW